MFLEFLSRIFGNKNEKKLKRLAPIVNSIKAFGPKMESLSDENLVRQTDILKSRIKMGETLEQLLPEAFATVREASVRTLGMKHYGVQILGGIILYTGEIAEMKTGEGKTLVATLPAYLHALTGKGVHIVTVNEYLSTRDAKWMGKLYDFLNISVSTLTQSMSEEERKKAYTADIIYGTNNEFAFDYLRDNMKFDENSLVQRDLYFSIIDEVDSILIDEARTPLIISGHSKNSTDLYLKIDSTVSLLNDNSDYKLDEKARSVSLTETGISKIEKILEINNIYDPQHIEVLHHVNQALKAYVIFKRDVDYIVKNGKVIIVDEFTGRLMPGRRYSEGLHQALEAKERVKIESENQTLATITFQNYFRMYKKLAGMTGTAITEADEFKKIYDLDVSIIPTNKPMIRSDLPDVIYKTKNEKLEAILTEIKHLNKKGQPVLVGTVSIDKSEELSKKLKIRKIKHAVLNAKNHEKEAEIIASAGQKYSVTISTNMAGRGTDIVLGEGVVELGGLHIIGTERHESRRIDNQLRGRSGRQGDPGSSRFYLSLQDDLLRIFGGDRIRSLMDRLGMDDEKPIEHKLVSRSIENAQIKVESHNFDIRKHLLEYDDVLNQQRTIIYEQRRNLLSNRSFKKIVKDIIIEKANIIADKCMDEFSSSEISSLDKISGLIFEEFNCRLNTIEKNHFHNLNNESLSEIINEKINSYYSSIESKLGSNNMRKLERIVMLQLVDSFWKDHLLRMEHLKEGIGLQGYAQQNPLFIYKKEGYEMFNEMILRIKSETVKSLFRIEIERSSNLDHMEKNDKQKLCFSSKNSENGNKKTFKRKMNKVGRNFPCPCGSNKKYKKCCGK